MPYIFLVLSILFAVSNNILLHYYNDESKKCNIFAFNTFVSLIWAGILFIISGGIGQVSLTTILYGIAYGVSMASFLFFKMASLGSGPVSITSLIGCCSLIVPSLVGIFVWNESVNVLQIIGLLALIVSIFLCVDPKSDIKISKKWIIYCVAFFTCAGVSAVIQKAFNKTDVSAEGNVMMVITALTAFVCFLALYLITKFSNGKKSAKNTLTKSVNKSFFKYNAIFIVLCGIVSCCYQRLNVYLAGALSGIVFFPIFNGSLIFLSCLSGVVLFKEKLSTKQILGLVFGTLSIMLIGNVFYFILS